jgi:hypothetical protein
LTFSRLPVPGYPRAISTFSIPLSLRPFFSFLRKFVCFSLTCLHNANIPFLYHQHALPHLLFRQRHPISAHVASQNPVDSPMSIHSVSRPPLSGALPGSTSSSAHFTNPAPFYCYNDPLILSSHTKTTSLALSKEVEWSTFMQYTKTVKQSIAPATRVPEHVRFPADEFVLCAFAASSFRRHTVVPPGVVSQHSMHGTLLMTMIGGAVQLRYVLNGVYNFTPGSSRRTHRPPASTNLNSCRMLQLQPAP